jgi:spore maturation protein SpmB
MFGVWLNGSFWLSLKVIAIVIGLMFLQKILDEFGAMQVLARIFKPLMKPMGLSEKTSFHWLIANAIGLTYGSAILIDQVETGKITPMDADLLNQHIAINHSMLEDTLLFVAIGVSAFWITIPRISIAIAAVWLYRGEKRYVWGKLYKPQPLKKLP